MRIAFTAKGQNWEAMIDERFGRTQYLVLFDEDSSEFAVVDNSAIGSVAHGAGPQTAKKLIDLSPDVLITGNGPGGNANSVLQQRNIKIYVGAGNMTIKQALEAFKNNSLQSL